MLRVQGGPEGTVQKEPNDMASYPREHPAETGSPSMTTSWFTEGAASIISPYRLPSGFVLVVEPVNCMWGKTEDEVGGPIFKEQAGLWSLEASWWLGNGRQSWTTIRRVASFPGSPGTRICIARRAWYLFYVNRANFSNEAAHCLMWMLWKLLFAIFVYRANSASFAAK